MESIVTSTTTDTDVLVEARSLGKQYRLFNRPIDRVKEALDPRGREYHTDFHALRDVSITVKRGESLAIIGRNGSGKSTLLKLITGIITPSEGSLDVRGRVAALLELGAGFNGEYTGVENVRLNGTIHGFTSQQLELKLPEILAFADIGDFAERPCKVYSSGMFARLAFAAMIHFEPDILVVDEALAVGDIFFQQKCFRWMKEKMAGVTKLIVSHDMGSVAQLATRAIVLDKGEMTFEGEPIKAIEHYTKTLHTEMFSNGVAKAPDDAAAPDESRFTLADPGSLGGAQEVKIVGWQVAVGKDGEEVVSTGTKTEVVKAGDVVHISLKLSCARAVEHVVVGVTVNDRFGQAIFGVNSLGSGHHLSIDSAGTKFATLQFLWPEIQSGRYLLTFGIGEGEVELDHVVQCWAHNVVSVEVLPLRAVHGIFNVLMRGVTIQ